MYLYSCGWWRHSCTVYILRSNFFLGSGCLLRSSLVYMTLCYSIPDFYLPNEQQVQWLTYFDVINVVPELWVKLTCLLNHLHTKHAQSVGRINHIQYYIPHIQEIHQYWTHCSLYKTHRTFKNALTSNSFTLRTE